MHALVDRLVADVELSAAMWTVDDHSYSHFRTRIARILTGQQIECRRCALGSIEGCSLSASLAICFAVSAVAIRLGSANRSTARERSAAMRARMAIERYHRFSAQRLSGRVLSAQRRAR
jgi:hypothetical protein